MAALTEIVSSFGIPFLLLLIPMYIYFQAKEEKTTTPEVSVQPKVVEEKKEGKKEEKPSAGFNPPSFGSSEEKVLPPPLSTPFSPEELKAFDGTDADKPVYVAVKGTIFDVSSNRATYSPGAGYHIFSGKDASRALGASSLKQKDCIDDISDLSEQQMQVLNNWYSFFEKRYPIVGVVKKE